MQENEKQIKSKDRVRQVAEVFTAKKQVCDMLDLVRDLSFNPTATVLEPSCGNGNFLAEVLDRKLKRVLEFLKSGRFSPQEKVELELIKTVMTIYGIDIMPDNIQETRERMKQIIKNFLSDNYGTRKTSPTFWDNLDWVLRQNIIVGDSLNALDKIRFLEFKCLRISYFKITEFVLIPSTDVFQTQKIYKDTHFYKLCLIQ